MIDSKKELFKWGPIDGRPIYIDAFVQAFVNYDKSTGVLWPDVCCYFKKDKVIVFIEYDALRNRGEKLFKKYILNDRKIKQAYSEWFEVVKRLVRIEGLVNKEVDNDNLIRLFKKWHRTYLDFWLTGFLPEIANWGGEQLLKREILKFNKLNFIEIFEGLSAPEDLSFFQKEEKELLRIKLIRNKGEQLKALKYHQKKYYWLRNNYGFTKNLDIEYFKKELDKLNIKDAKKKIKEIENYPKKVRERKEELVVKYKINKKIVKIAERLSYCIWWQDYRKKFIFIANHINSEFLKSIAKVKEMPFKELCYYTAQEIINLLGEDKKINAKDRFDGFSIYYTEGKSLTYKIGKEANDFVRPYLKVKIDKDLKEIRGLVVSKEETIRGKVKIVLTPRNLDKMEEGDILVAPMTSPDFIVAMRKASAIITDEGSMTCHAAIVSRELRIPCIVGTRVATRTLRDEFIVEVDTNKGVVRIVKK